MTNSTPPLTPETLLSEAIELDVRQHSFVRQLQQYVEQEKHAERLAKKQAWRGR